MAPKLSGFRIADITYVGNQGWALGTARCLSGGGSNCSAIEHSTNGRSWASLPTPTGITVDVGRTSGQPCATDCIDHIRFASAKVGYLFSDVGQVADRPGALFVTTDGGLHWSQQPGGASALESLNGNVIRVTTTTQGCPPGCTFVAQASSVGASSWHTVKLPGEASQGDGAELTRTGDHAYLLTVGNPAGGAQRATSVLYVSGDNGANWTNRGEPCPRSGGREVDSSDLTSAPDGSVSVLCRVRAVNASPYTATSTSDGASFHTGSRTALGGAGITAFAAASARTLVVSSDETYRSTDGGRHFARLSANAGSSPGQLSYLGFASSSVGHGISSDRRRIWTTTDGGLDWSSHTFS